jgi:hypothetical protein
MSGIITFGVEWETKLLSINMNGAKLREKVAYTLRNGNRDPKNKYSLEAAHAPRPRKGVPDKSAEYTHMTRGCIYALEFIFGVFDTMDQFEQAIQEFYRVINDSLCQDQPRLEIEQENGEIQNSYIVEAIDYRGPIILKNAYTDCSLQTVKPHGPGLGIYFGNQCPIIGRGQLTIGLDLNSTGQLLTWMVRSPLLPSNLELSGKQNFRDSGFKMASHFLYNVMASPPQDPIVSVLCYWMVYPIINLFRSRQIAKEKEEIKAKARREGKEVPVLREIEYLKALLPLKGRSNLTCLAQQLLPQQRAVFEAWYNTNRAFLTNFFPIVRGYKFRRSYPEYNIDEKYIYSVDIHPGDTGVSNIQIQGNRINFTMMQGGVPQNMSIDLSEQEVVLGEFMVWTGRLAPLKAVASSDGKTLIFQGAGNPAFDSADVNEWWVEPPAGRTTYNIVEVRELDKFYQEPGAALGATRIPQLEVGNLYNVIRNVSLNLQQITTTSGVQLHLSVDEYNGYLALYAQQDHKTVAGRVVGAMEMAREDYARAMQGGNLDPEMQELMDGLDDDIDWNAIDDDIDFDSVLAGLND